MDEERITFEIDFESAKRFKKKCIDKDVSMSNIMRKMIWEWIGYYPQTDALKKG